MSPIAKQIRSHAVWFRECLKQLQNQLSPGFMTFPAGSCGEASRLLGQWLAEKGLSDLVFVCGSRRGNFHSWLEHRGLIIDITADQFTDGPGAVFVSRDRTFHAQFTDQVRFPHRLDEELKLQYLLCRKSMIGACNRGESGELVSDPKGAARLAQRGSIR